MKRTKRECYIGEDGYCHIPLANGKGEAICDAEFIEEVNKYNWSLWGRDKGYASAWINKKRIFMHRFLFLLKYSFIEKGFCLDHINKKELDNRMCNLRQATFSQNQMNKNKISGNFKGVSFNKLSKKYLAKIEINKKRIYLGSFQKEEDAAYAYDAAAFHYFKEFCVLNFPQKTEEYKNLNPIDFIYKNTKATSKFFGVFFAKDKKLFRARVKVNGKYKHIGYFKDELSAAHARDLYIIKNNLNKKLNFPLETYQNELNQEPKNMVVFKAN